ncbi:MAG: hypothetical protein EXR98_04270 [Gemmataceae bacterium]|nr:hypothetical protein [Gemmataceae bacterium]
MATHIPPHDDNQANQGAGEKRTPKPTKDADQPPTTPKPAPPAFPDLSIDKPDEEPLLVEEVLNAEDIPLVTAAPDSAVEIVDEEVIEVEPVEEAVEAGEEVLLDDAAVVMGSSAVHAAESAVLTPAEAVAAAPAADVDLMKMYEEESASEPAPAAESAAAEIAAAAPSLDVTPDDAVFEEAFAEPTAPDEAVVEVAPAAPASNSASRDYIVDEIAEAAPASEVKAEDVLFDEAVAAPVSETKTAEVAAEVVEVVEEASSPTRKYQAVLEDEVEAAEEVVSGVEVAEEAIEEAEPVSAVADEAVMDAEEVAVTGSSAVASDEVVDLGSAVKKKPSSGVGKTAAFEQTMAFEPSASSGSRKKPDSDVDLEGAAVDDSMKRTAGSVEFDELLDEVADESTPTKKKKPTAAFDDEVTEMDAEAVEEAIEEAEEAVEPTEEAETPVSSKKAKAPVKATGDDIDLADMFGDSAEIAEAEEADEAEAVEAVDADEPAEAEAAEAFDDGLEGAEAVDAEEAVEAEDDASFFDDEEDAKPKTKAKIGKKSKVADEDDEEAEAIEDEDEDFSAKKKKKGKEKVTVAPTARGGCFMPLVGGMFLAILLIAGGVGATFWFAPEQIDELMKMHPERQAGKDKPKPPDGGKGVELTKAQKARDLIEKGKFKEAMDEADGNEPAELSARGEARWFAYYKEQADKKGLLDENADAVKTALDELTKGQNQILAAQIRGQFEAAAREKTLSEQLTKLKGEKDDVDKQLKTTTVDNEKAMKLIDSLADVLVKGKFIDDKASFDAVSLQKIMKGLSDDRTVLETVNKILKKEVLKIKKGLEDNVAAVTKVLDNEKTKDKGATGVLEIVDARNKVTKDRDDLMATLASAFKEFVDGKIVPPGADPRKDLVAGAKAARQKAESPLAIPLGQLGQSLGNIGTGTGKVVEHTFDLARVFSELSYFRTREPFVETPQQKMNTYITLLQDRKQNDPKRLADISREAEWVREPTSKSDEESRGKARFVQGLALRNLEKFAEARNAIDESLKIVQKLGKSGVWAVYARKSHDELTDPAVYFLPRITQFQIEENYSAALAEASLALRALPGDARLHTQRALVRLDLIRGKGAKAPEAARKDIRADADAAKDKLASESAYILGLLEEELQNLNQAEMNLRIAIKLNDDRKGSADEAGRYRIALARLLLRDRPEVAPAPPAPEEKKKEDKGAHQNRNTPRAPREEIVTTLHPWSLLIVTAVISQEQFEELEDPATLARYKEAIEEAYKLIASKNEKLKGEGYLALGKALSKLGKRSEGLKAYSEGLKLIHKGITTTELKELIDAHPAFQQPDTSATPNPVMAERHFGEGMHHYWAKKYPEAEAQFQQAVKYYERDARYFYYAGLAQIAQKTKLKRDVAIYSFEQGARLEAKAASTNPLAVREINASLERIQGELRQQLNSYRYKAAAGSEPPAVVK